MHCWSQCKLVQSLWKAVESFLKKKKLTKNELPYGSASPLLRIYPKKNTTPMFTVALFTIVKNMKVLSSINEDDICMCVCLHIYMLSIYSAIKKNANLPFATT